MADKFYQQVTLDEIKQPLIVELVEEYVKECIDKPSVQSAVDYVMENLPSGVARVDGYCIEPLLNEILNPSVAPE